MFRSARVLAVLVACLALASSARATFSSLAERLPPAANAMIAINVDRVLNSALATREGWRQDLEGAWERQPLMISPRATRVLYVASVNTTRLDPYWEMALIEMKGACHRPRTWPPPRRATWTGCGTGWRFGSSRPADKAIS